MFRLYLERLENVFERLLFGCEITEFKNVLGFRSSCNSDVMATYFAPFPSFGKVRHKYKVFLG